MAIRPEAAVAGAVLYSRGRHKMGNTRLSTISQYDVRVVESWDPEKGYALASWNGNPPRRYYAHELKRLFSWSMYDEDEASVTRGVCDRITKVTRRKPCPRCKRRHAAEACPPKEATP